MRKLVIFCLFLASGGVASAQSVLPAGFGQWTGVPLAASAKPSLEQVTGANAPLFKEYGYQSLQQSDYLRKGDTLHVTLYRMADPTAAYGAFTLLRSAATDLRTSTLERYAALGANRALIVVGNYLLDVTGKHIPHRADDDLSGLTASLKTNADQRAFPAIGDHLPPEGLEEGSERYILGPLALQQFAPLATGDWVGFGDGAEAIEAKYRAGKQEATLLVIEYPTQQIAARHFNQISTLATSDTPADPSADHPAITAQRKAGLVSLAFAPRRGPFASALLDQVILGHDVVWNEAPPIPGEKSWPVYIIGAFAGTGLIIVYAIISGLGFAIFRVVMKFFFPGKVFDRPQSIEILQLGLTNHPVDTRDFYYGAGSRKR